MFEGQEDGECYHHEVVSHCSGMEATAAKHNFDDVPRVVKQPFMDKLEFFKGCLDGAACVLNDDGHGSLPVKDLKDECLGTVRVVSGSPTVFVSQAQERLPADRAHMCVKRSPACTSNAPIAYEPPVHDRT